jgi:myo-inositol-1(or 4)-monophosphatase
MIAGGALDGSFVKPHAHDWDIAAAALILSEAGGTLIDRSGGAPRFAGPDTRHGSLAAGSGEMLAMMATVLASDNA